MTDTALQAAPATKARGYWATVGRRIARDKVSMVCAFILLLIFLSAISARRTIRSAPTNLAATCWRA